MRVSKLCTICLLLVAGPAVAQLLHYDFESIELQSGPDTFQLFEEMDTDVSISPYYAYRGRSSLHILDRGYNTDFPEFLGHFQTIDKGTLEISFALMTSNAREVFNIAFAGEGHFKMAPDGMGFWLVNDAGTLRHVSDSIPKLLFKLTDYQWYWFEVAMDMDKGVYALKVFDEAGSQLLDLAQQANPTNQPSLSLSKYSFVGDLQDRADASFYIDELTVRASSASPQADFIAPGRRSLFVDQWNEYAKKIESLDFCLPPRLPFDFITAGDEQNLKVLQREAAELKRLLLSRSAKELEREKYSDTVLQGIRAWASGCLAVKKGQFQAAIEHFEIAQSSLGDVPATQMGLVLAYAHSGYVYSAQAILSFNEITEDYRWAVLSAAVGFISDRPEDSELALDLINKELFAGAEGTYANLMKMGWVSDPAMKVLRKNSVWDEQASDFVLAEMHYFALLWQGKFAAAQVWSERILGLLSEHKLVSVLWAERLADAALLARNLDVAERGYQQVIDLEASMSARQKLADVYFLKGDHEAERKVRQAIFGALDFDK